MENESDVTTSIRNLNGFVLRERTLRVDVAKKQYNGMARKYATTRGTIRTP